MLQVAPYVLYQNEDNEYLDNSGLKLFNEFAGQATLTVVDQIVTPTGFQIDSALNTGGVVIGTGADVNIAVVGFDLGLTLASAIPDIDNTEFPDGFGISIQLGDPLAAANYNENVIGFPQLALALGIPQIDTGVADAAITPTGFVITSSLGTPTVQVPSGTGSTTGVKRNQAYRAKIRRDR